MRGFAVRDLRRKEKFQVDDAYLNGYARLCGWKATLVYISLCRHADKNQRAFPSINLISEELKIARGTVIAGLRDLERWVVILSHKERNKTGKWLNSTYILLDRSQWKPKPYQVNHVDSASYQHQVHVSTHPSPPRGLTQVHHVDSKDTQMKDTHIRKERIVDNLPKIDEDTIARNKEIIDEIRRKVLSKIPKMP